MGINKMKLTIVYDNEIYEKGIGLKSDWGFSCLVETKSNAVLFDTGGNGKILLNNMECLGIDIDNIDNIVISHEHWDHNGGLEALALFVSDVDLYRIRNNSPSNTMHLFIASDPCQITKRIFTTGIIKGIVDEQSLVIKDNESCYILVGCSHPGVGKIFNVVKKYGNIAGVVGGLHDFNNFHILEYLDFICPCHCTKHKQELKKIYPKKFVEGGVGRIIEI